MLFSEYASDAEASRYHHSDVMRSVLLKMKVPAICVVNQATLAMFSARRTWGILVNIGFLKTTVYPIENGAIRRKSSMISIGVGGLKLTKYLRKQLHQRNLHVPSLYNARSLKEKLCYVALDYEAELLKDTEASCTLSTFRDSWCRS
ncbi:hypothetical protein L2E82_38165 [Cichorium intybus]|uniref:Uncharacterized protein n=1 Tax=Cichorium intybus TaxID=13427 RepID=A0ACB9AFX5_CICIN|nr:hypothetical protein L2E82_38165 [Cichorium intybus]